MRVDKVRWGNLRQTWVIFLLLLPTVAGVALFSYTPAVEAIRHSFYQWDGAFTEEYIGLENFRRLLGRLDLWAPVVVAAALALAGVMTDRVLARRVWLGMSGAALAVMVAMLVKDAGALVAAGKLRWAQMGWVWFWLAGGVGAGVARLSMPGRMQRRRRLALVGAYVLPLIAGVAYLVTVKKVGDGLFWMSFKLIIVLVVANLFKMWPSIFTAVCIHRLRSDRWQYAYRVMFVVPMIIPQMVGLLIWKFFYDPNIGPLNKMLTATGLDKALIWLDAWVLHMGVFVEPFKPVWLGNPDLIVPALVFWGFPWVGVVGVLIYLAGLQNISDDVYEAAELDGIGWWGKFWRIELPLIMTQVRLNLVLMVIGTIQAFGFQLILLGASGGQQNKGLTPGLYMFYQAFQQQNYGYACAIGLLLFFIILGLTMINQKYVRVDK